MASAPLASAPLAAAPLASGAAGGDIAEPDHQAGSSASLAEGEFVLGSGQAVASLLVAVARTGNIPIPFPLSQAGALYQGIDAGATSRALGIPGAPAPPASSPSRPAEESPIPANPFLVSVTARATDGENGSSKDETMAATPPGAPVVVGMQRQQASADRAPSARSTTTSSFISVPGAFGLSAGRTASLAAVHGRERAAEAEATIATLELGPVRLDGLRWTAVHRSGEAGATLASEAVFSLAGASIAGQALPVPADSPGDLFSALNTALAPLGLALEAPRLESSQSSAVATPLVVKVFGSEAGKRGLAPAIGALQPAREPVAEALLALDPRVGLLLTGVDVMLGVLAGSNSLSFEVGGASATTEGLVYENPFGPGLLPGSPSPVKPLFPAAPVVPSGGHPETDLYVPSAAEEVLLDGDPTNEIRKPVTRTVRRVVRRPAQTASDAELRSGELASVPPPTDRAMVAGLAGLLVALLLAAADRVRPRRA